MFNLKVSSRKKPQIGIVLHRVVMNSAGSQFSVAKISDSYR